MRGAQRLIGFVEATRVAVEFGKLLVSGNYTETVSQKRCACAQVSNGIVPACCQPIEIK